jgi:hypothetical protein
MYFFRPFNYQADGVFARASDAWFIEDDGLITAVLTGNRRVMTRGPTLEQWIWMEGARENFVDSPLDCANAVDWNNPAASSGAVVNPLGATATVGVIVAPADIVSQSVTGGAIGALISASVFARSTTDVLGTAIFNVTNVTPAVGVVAQAMRSGAPSGFFSRTKRNNLDATGAGAKSIELTAASVDAFAWGFQFEAGPGFAQDAKFTSQPILVRGVRQAESFTAGAISQAMIDKGALSIRISFEPEYNETECFTGNARRLVLLDTGAAATSIILFMEATAPGVMRARAGFQTGTFVASGSLTFSAGQRLTLDFTLATGTLIVTGATTGSGTFINGVYSLTANAAVQLGGLTTTSAYALLGPLEIGYADRTVTGLDQLTLNSARVTFSDDMLQFDPRGLRDALNPSNYILSGSSGLPLVQRVEPGDVASQVVVFFDDDIVPGSLVRLSATNIVSAGVVPVGVAEGARAALDLFVATSGALDTVLEVVTPGADGNNGRFSIFEWLGDPNARPGTLGVVVELDSTTTAPRVIFRYIASVTTLVEMEESLAAVVPTLIRVKIPGSQQLLFNPLDLDHAAFAGGVNRPFLSFIAFGGEVNVVAQEQATFPRVDIANPQTPDDAAQNASLGTFGVTDAGDLANDHGRLYLRKRIFRRLGTFKAGYFHLPGYGLAQPSKVLFTPTTLRRLKVDVEQQIRQEPGVVAALAQVTELSPGIVSVKLRIQDDSGSFSLEGALDFTAA